MISVESTPALTQGPRLLPSAIRAIPVMKVSSANIGVDQSAVRSAGTTDVALVRRRATSALCTPTMIVSAIAMVMWVASSSGLGIGVTYRGRDVKRGSYGI